MATSIRQLIMTALKTQLATITTTNGYNLTISSVNEWRDYEEESILNVIDIRDFSETYNRTEHQQDEYEINVLVTFISDNIEDIRKFAADLITFVRLNQSFQANVEMLDFAQGENDNIDYQHDEYKLFFYNKNLRILYKTEIWNPYQ